MMENTRSETLGDPAIRAIVLDLRSTVHAFFQPLTFLARALRSGSRGERMACVATGAALILAASWAAASQSADVALPPPVMLYADVMRLVPSPSPAPAPPPPALQVRRVQYAAPEGAKTVLNQVNTNAPQAGPAEIAPVVVERQTGSDEVKRAAEAGDPAAMHKLAFIYLDGVDGARDNGLAFQWFSRAANAGYAPSQCALAALFQGVNGWESNDIKSYQWLLVADRRGGGCSKPLLQQVRDRIADEDRSASERRAARFIPQDGGLPG